MKKYCELPFTDLRSFASGKYSICCACNNATTPPMGIQNENPMEFFQSKFMNRLRRDMIISPDEPKGLVKKVCGQCIELEKNGLKSIREPSEWYGRENTEEKWINKRDGVVDLKNKTDRTLRIKLNFYGNECNLECYMCEPFNSTRRMKVYKKLDKKYTQFIPGEFYPEKSFEDNCYLEKGRFEEISESILKYKHLISMIEVSGGEPAIMKRHLDFLRNFIESGDSKDIFLSYITNLTILSEEWISIIKEFKREEVWDGKRLDGLDMQWSCDDIEKRAEWIRYPCNWKKIVDNIYLYRKTFPNGGLRVTNCPSILSIMNVDKFYIKMLELGFKENEIMFNNILNSPSFLAPRHLPTSLKTIVNKKLKNTNLEFLLYFVNQKGDKKEFDLCIEYLDELDRQRGTSWITIFPELRGVEYE